jgi:hypothetical protein
MGACYNQVGLKILQRIVKRVFSCFTASQIQNGMPKTSRNTTNLAKPSITISRTVT